MWDRSTEASITSQASQGVTFSQMKNSSVFNHLRQIQLNASSAGAVQSISTRRDLAAASSVRDGNVGDGNANTDLIPVLRFP